MAERRDLHLTPEQVAAIGALRDERKVSIAPAIAAHRSRAKDMTRIKRLLREQPMTVPELAQATGIAPDQVLWYVTALKRYDGVVEGAKDDDYFRYSLPAGAKAEADED
jgi:hypothetical protein